MTLALSLMTMAVVAACGGGYFWGYRLRFNDDFDAWMKMWDTASDEIFAEWLESIGLDREWTVFQVAA